MIKGIRLGKKQDPTTSRSATSTAAEAIATCNTKGCLIVTQKTQTKQQSTQPINQTARQPKPGWKEIR